MKDKPFISFIVTVFNLENYIANCLDSILSQPIKDYEIIVIDHCSGDNSIKICEEYEKKHCKNIRFYKMPVPDTKTSANYKLAFEAARGEYIQFIDGDDRLKKDCMGEIIPLLKEKKVDLLMGRFECVLEDPKNNKYNFIDTAFDENKINNTTYGNALDYLAYMPNLYTSLWRLIFKKSLFEDIYKSSEHFLYNEFPKSFRFDEIITMRILCKANSIYYHKDTMYLYTRRTDGSGTGYVKTGDLYIDLYYSFLEALLFVYRCKPKQQKLKYCMARIDYLFSFFVGSMSSACGKEYQKISALTEENIELFEVLKFCGIERLENFYGYIRTHGSAKGIMLYFEYLKVKFKECLESAKGCDIYLFPLGNKSFLAAKLIQSMGFQIKGFFDNDDTKQGHKYFDAMCYPPNEILKFSDEEKKNLRIVISVIDDKLVKILQAQLKELGISKKNIIVKE